MHLELLQEDSPDFLLWTVWRKTSFLEGNMLRRISIQRAAARMLRAGRADTEGSGSGIEGEMPRRQ